MVSVVRTESQLARFNTARALFEKLGVFDVKDVADKVKDTRSSSSSSRLGSDSSQHNSVISFISSVAMSAIENELIFFFYV